MTTPEKYEGDPRFAERKFTDTPGRPPPLFEGLLHDPYFKYARTHADDTIAEAESDATAPVSVAGVEPEESEFSYGKGLMAPISRGHEPTQIEQLKAVQRTNPANPASVASYDDWIRES